MLDIKILREQTQDVRGALEARGAGVDVDAILRLDAARRGRIAEVESLKNKRNVASREIGRLKKEGQDIAPLKEEMRRLGDVIAEQDSQVRTMDARFDEMLLRVPNLPHPSAPIGPDASENRLVRSVGERREFAFKPSPHWEIGERLGLFDFERAAKMTGAGFPLYVGVGARLERALIQFMLDVHVNEHGYREISPPFLCNADAMTGTGQLPKMAEDMYHLPADGLYLIPTAEVPLTNMYREEIIEEDLPICLTGYTPCFRREAGAAGRETRGLNRVHQFDKVEMVKFVEPDHSDEELDRLVGDAEDILQRLELPYRVLELCTGDLSFAAARCYDLELWAPGQEVWLEVSSCSLFGDFQARRAGIRYRDADGKTAFVHTLNGSGVALARLVVALLENGQEADGSVTLPRALHPYLQGLERLVAPPAAAH